MLPTMSLPRLLAVAVLACLPLLAGAKTLRYASQDDPQTLDPHSANLLATSRLRFAMPFDLL